MRRLCLKILMILLGVTEGAAFGQEVISRPVDESYEEGWTKVRQFSKEEVAKICKEHEGSYIGYYEEIFKVEKCKRRLLMDSNSHIKKNSRISIKMVDPQVIAALPLGEPLTEGQKTTRRGCRELEGKYVTYSFTDIFMVRNCRLRYFPDWETFQEHRKKNNTMTSPIISLTEQEFFSLKEARPMASVIDQEYRKVLTGEAGVDVIPLDEACEGVEGKDVFYYSRIYRIEKCRKREYDAESYIRKHGGKVKVKELSSSQWLSLPDGKPMDENLL